MSHLQSPFDVSLTEIVDHVLNHLGPRLVIGTPLGLGKPNELLNLFYRRAARDESVQLEIITALSLDIPRGKSDLEQRFLEPFAQRHFGADYPRLAWLDDQRKNSVPNNIKISEFYLQPGAALRWTHAQRHYTASNYTHVARDMADRGVNLILQMVAQPPDGSSEFLSLSCNPDVSLDLADRLKSAGEQFLAVAMVHDELPYMGRSAEVPASFFTHRIKETASHALYALPATPVTAIDHAIGLHASTLVPDGGTLQIGIGALSDALTYSTILRDADNNEYQRRATAASVDKALATRLGGLSPFARGLYGASELLMDGFAALFDAGILRRAVFPTLEQEQASADGKNVANSDGQRTLMQAAFFLGSSRLYAFLRNLPPEARSQFDMTRVSVVNQLYGGSEPLEVLQRRDSRFLNTCMKMTLLGDAASETLDNGSVVSGVGGQYNFVAMAHAMRTGRSILMLRSTRTSGSGQLQSNIVWSYGRTTIPRHLRDLVVTEYGVADLRGQTDRDCIVAMLAITDARCVDSLVSEAIAAGKLESDFVIPDQWRRHTPDELKRSIQIGDQPSEFPLFPLGCDFDETERRLIPALGWLKSQSQNRVSKWRLILRALGTSTSAGHYDAELGRLGLRTTRGLKLGLTRRLVLAALGATESA